MQASVRQYLNLLKRLVNPAKAPNGQNNLHQGLYIKILKNIIAINVINGIITTIAKGFRKKEYPTNGLISCNKAIFQTIINRATTQKTII